jgi:hypothetical protein
MEAFPDSGKMINGCPGTGTTWGHGRRLPDGTVEITPDDLLHYHTQGVRVHIHCQFVKFLTSSHTLSQFSST